MVNILSCNGKAFPGKEIKAWIEYHALNQTEYSRIARSMMRYRNLVDDKYYWIRLRPAGTGCGEVKRYRPDVITAPFGDERDLYG